MIFDVGYPPLNNIIPKSTKKITLVNDTNIGRVIFVATFENIIYLIHAIYGEIPVMKKNFKDNLYVVDFSKTFLQNMSLF